MPSDLQLKAIVEAVAGNRIIEIGRPPMAAGVKAWVDPDRLFGRHLRRPEQPRSTDPPFWKNMIDSDFDPQEWSQSMQSWASAGGDGDGKESAEAEQ